MKIIRLDLPLKECPFRVNVLATTEIRLLWERSSEAIITAYREGIMTAIHRSRAVETALLTSRV